MREGRGRGRRASWKGDKGDVRGRAKAVLEVERGGRCARVWSTKGPGLANRQNGMLHGLGIGHVWLLRDEIGGLKKVLGVWVLLDFWTGVLSPSPLIQFIHGNQEPSGECLDGAVCSQQSMV